MFILCLPVHHVEFIFVSTPALTVCGYGDDPAA